MNPEKLNKERNFLGIAEFYAKTLSKDRSTQVGAFFLHPEEFTILASGYNGIPRGCNDGEPSRHERPLKYKYFEHGERNAIFNQVREHLRGSILTYLSKEGPPCMDDIRAAISCGAKVLKSNWAVQDKDALALLSESNVQQVVVRLEDSALPEEAYAKFSKMSPEGTELLITAAEEGDSVKRGYVLRETAVRKAVYALARLSLEGSTLVVGPLPPCYDCAKALVQCGVPRVVSRKASPDHEARWGAHLEETRKVFKAFGVDHIEL
jgi:dCMP deaminase